MSDQGLKTILVVDDEPANITVLSGTLKDKYRVIVAKNGKQAIERIENVVTPDLILLDIMMPDMDGYELCSILKERPETKDIPIIFVSAMSEFHDEEKGLELGAIDYISKPFSPAIVLTRVRNILQLRDAQTHLEQYNKVLEERVAERTREVFVTQNITIHALASLAETRDNETGNHIRRTQYYVKTLATQLMKNGFHLDELNSENIDLMYRSAPLHDIGKVGIPDDILLKPGKLDADEFKIMMTHASLGAQALMAAQAAVGKDQTSFLRYAREIAECHHEKWDGSGYPQGLKGEEIPISGRIMALADVYEALISERVYKPSFSHDKAKEIILEGKGKHFDPKVVDAFLQTESQFKTIAAEFKD
ncbi:response regulator [Marinomonas fungiae]|uniref:Response regulator c-di-GMP phosphodiesterase, RpfG family, contains REC and HD-GYP domains n=1 Tax=Marinomonas fungiae TaxID=1137284 RepID=A0A0K6IJS5_9GAMM|nr:two-component system response regulator [Marinomonas fungiae]CUB03360.1 Response regulator c-di-GMP phosphodiesterase, RpfG family, contains REC and HD-GYP domains [Marinomonas fungiae]